VSKAQCRLLKRLGSEALKGAGSAKRGTVGDALGTHHERKEAPEAGVEMQPAPGPVPSFDALVTQI